MTHKPLIILLLVLFPLVVVAQGKTTLSKKEKQELEWLLATKAYLTQAEAGSFLYTPAENNTLDTVFQQKGVNINFTKGFIDTLLCEEEVIDIEFHLRQSLKLSKQTKLKVTVDNDPLELYLSAQETSPIAKEKTEKKDKEAKAPLSSDKKNKTPRATSAKEKLELEWLNATEAYLLKAEAGSFDYTPAKKNTLDTLFLNRSVNINFNKGFIDKSITKEDIADIRLHLRENLDLPSKTKLKITVNHTPIEQYLPQKKNSKSDEIKTKELSKKEKQEQEWLYNAEAYLTQAEANSFRYTPIRRSKVDTVFSKRGVNINFSEEFAYKPLREEDIKDIRQHLEESLKLPKRKRLNITVDHLPLEQYIPEYYKYSNNKEKTNNPYKGLQNVTNLSTPNKPSQGLNNRHIALWNSHGRYYNHQEKEWKWQRAPLFSTVEDLFTSAYIYPFLLPMLENAGANVYLPRERDTQVNEAIVDNADAGFRATGKIKINNEKGFKNDLTLDRSDLNPFAEGNHVELKNGALAIWNIKIPEDGQYAVYVSYVSHPKSSQKANYTLYHDGGTTSFSVNQTMGGGTWIYLGHFFFKKGKKAKIMLRGKGKQIVTADAVKIGGGMGDIPREGLISGVPRWQEAARYNLQYAGALDTLTFNRHGDTIDYNDDFRSRARWVNYLKGGDAIEPWLVKDAKVEGLNIPIDLAVGLHTDAGHFLSMDTVVGTLAICSTYDVEDQRTYRNKKSRLGGRDLADLIQTQLVDDLCALHDKNWKRREIWDKMYSEATFADVPSLLFELHSHGNAQDMRYGLDPQFRFDASRALYKGMLRFLSAYYDRKYTVQPLPVSAMAISTKDGQHILSWEPTTDPLEPSAKAEAYIVYTRRGDHGWDNGKITKNNSYIINTNSKDILTYKVTATNAGGESFPSTLLSTASISDTCPTILVVDGFTRVSAPAFMENGDSVGLAPWIDEGVAWGTDIATIGWQYEYDQKEPWKSDDIPGHGASHKDLSGTLFLGNNFDHSYTYTKAIARAGYNVMSCSMAALEQGNIQLNGYDAILFAFGEQRTTTSPQGKTQFGIYSPKLITKIEDYCQQEGAHIGFWGAHIGKETLTDTTGRSQQFAKDILGFTYGGEVGDKHNAIFSETDSSLFKYNTDYSQDYYRLEHADKLSPCDSTKVLFSFLHQEEAVVCFEKKHRAVSSSIPLECILNREDQFLFMEHYLNTLFANSPKNTTTTDE